MSMMNKWIWPEIQGQTALPRASGRLRGKELEIERSDWLSSSLGGAVFLGDRETLATSTWEVSELSLARGSSKEKTCLHLGIDSSEAPSFSTLLSYRPISTQKPIQNVRHEGYADAAHKGYDAPGAREFPPSG